MSRKADESVDTRELATEELWRREADLDGDDGDTAEAKLPPAHKDTKSWCKGKIGRQHTLAIQVPDNAWSSRGCRWVYSLGSEPWYNCIHVELCTTCGKIFRRNYGLSNAEGRTALLPEECPDYEPADV